MPISRKRGRHFFYLGFAFFSCKIQKVTWIEQGVAKKIACKNKNEYAKQIAYSTSNDPDSLSFG